VTLIQPILVGAILAVAMVHLKAFSSRLLSRAATLMFVALGVAFVVNPELTNDIAHMVGVGRGTDLVLYALFPATISMFLHLYRRNRQLEERLTGMARHIAIREAARLGSTGSVAGKTAD
jgi:hypothetical protein